MKHLKSKISKIKLTIFRLNKIIPFLVVGSIYVLVSAEKIKIEDDFYIEIAWFNNLKGDFSFSNKWNYAENIGLNNAQQIVCLNNCSSQVQAMIDKNGLIKTDSIDAYYRIVDSTRKYHTFESRTSFEKRQPLPFIKVRKFGNFTIEGNAIGDSLSSCSLFFRMKDNLLTAWVYQKEKDKNSRIYKLSGGKFFLDKVAFEKGLFKATFSFTFENQSSKVKALYWSGKIYTKIEGY